MKTENQVLIRKESLKKEWSHKNTPSNRRRMLAVRLKELDWILSEG